MFTLRQDNWWIADWEGDPPRTLNIESAKRYKTERGAKLARAYYKKRYSHIRKIDLKIESLSRING